MCHSITLEVADQSFFEDLVSELNSEKFRAEHNIRDAVPVCGNRISISFKLVTDNFGGLIQALNGKVMAVFPHEYKDQR